MDQPGGQVTRTFFEKVWSDHVIRDMNDGSALLQIDRLLLHEVTGGVSLRELRASGRKIAQPSQVFTVIDHVVSIKPGRQGGEGRNAVASAMIRETLEFSTEEGVRVFNVGDPRQGIVHVISPELGLALPGTTLVCGDSHTMTVGALGVLGWGIGSSESVHVLATQTLRQSKPKTMRISFEGRLQPGVSTKDLALFMIGRLGVNGGIGYAVEFAGPVIREMSIEGRLTLCNMATELSARYAFVAPDEVTFDFLKGREFAPKNEAWELALGYWRGLVTDEGASFDLEHTFDVAEIGPQITWGTSPQQVTGINGRVPAPDKNSDPGTRALAERALEYQRLEPGTVMDSVPIDIAYIGSCTNARLSDLAEAADILRGRKVANGVQAICVPGSTSVKLAAEASGIDQIFRDAGFEWMESGCGFCAVGGADRLQNCRVVSTTNRNFENRQGPQTRTHLASPATVAASAVLGHLADPRTLQRTGGS